MPLEQRRLAAILVADVVGYSRLMGEDERGTLARLAELRHSVIEPRVGEHGGRLFKAMGDGFLIEFHSAVQAVSCAVGIQRAVLPLPLRIGIHVGDVVVQGDDLVGDGVNIAARLEAVADPGGVAISRQVHDQVRGKLPFGFEDKGEVSLKNIVRPVQVFMVTGQPVLAVATSMPASLALPDKPSIAVLPFQNMSGDPEQEYFADGMVEDIITALSRFKTLFVIARNSSFTYKGRAVDIKQVGRELGVRYVLEGSVRKAGGRVRITGQLIDSDTGAHLWADRFEGPLADVFELQDEVTKCVVGCIAPRVTEAEIERAKRKPADRLDAYEYFLRGMAKVYEHKVEAWTDALPLFRRSAELDPQFAPPYAMSSRYPVIQKLYRRMPSGSDDVAEVRRLASHVSIVGTDDSFSLSWAGHSLVMICGDHDAGNAMADQAMKLNANLATCWQVAGSMSMYGGHHDVAIEQLLRALRFNPVGPDSFQIAQSMAAAYMFQGSFTETLAWCARVLRQQPVHLLSLQMSAVAHHYLGNRDEARRFISLITQVHSSVTLSSEKGLHPLRRSVDSEKWYDGLRGAGLSE